MAFRAAASRQSGQDSMAQPRENSPAIAAIVECIFPKSLRQPITRRGSNSRDPKVGTKSSRIALDALIPLRRRIGELGDAGRERGPCDGVRAERIENVVAGHGSLRRLLVGQVQRPRGHAWGGAGGVAD